MKDKKIVLACPACGEQEVTPAFCNDGMAVFGCCDLELAACAVMDLHAAETRRGAVEMTNNNLTDDQVAVLRLATTRMANMKSPAVDHDFWVKLDSVVEELQLHRANDAGFAGMVEDYETKLAELRAVVDQRNGECVRLHGELEQYRKAASAPDDFLSRMHGELHQLRSRAKGLDAFIGTPSYRALSESSRAAMIRQRDVMAEYIEVLHHRIRLAESDNG